jgi:hypothetical protein
LETNNGWRVILLCVSGAVIFWLFNALNKEYTTEVNYPVHFVVDTTKVTFTEEPPHKIYLEVTGVGWNLLRYLLHLNVQPIELPVEKVSRKGLVSQNRLYSILSKQLKDLKVNKVMIDNLYLHTQPKVSSAH